MDYIDKKDFIFLSEEKILSYNTNVLIEKAMDDNNKIEVKTKFLELSKKVLKALAGKDLTEDKDMTTIYKAINNLMNINIILGAVPILGLIPRITSTHLMTKTLPKYRNKLFTIYRKKIKDIDKAIDNLDQDNENYKTNLNKLKNTKSLLYREINKIRVYGKESEK